MNNNITTTPLVYKGEIIRDKGEMLSLTDMWIAGGRDDAKRPANWARKEGAGFIDHTAVILNVPVGHIIKGTRGRTGETFAHWQAALAYAKYLNHDFHMWCNEVVRAHMEGAKPATTLPADVLELIRRDDGISRMLAHKVTGIESTIAALTAAVATIASIVQPPETGIYLTGKTAGEIWKAAGFPQIKVTSWFSNRLCKMGCQMEGGRRVPMGLGRAKLFDPDKADRWLKNGGRALVEKYILERTGQKSLSLAPGPKPEPEVAATLRRYQELLRAVS